MGTSFALTCCRAAAFFTMKPALHTPIFKKKMLEVSGRVVSATVQIVTVKVNS